MVRSFYFQNGAIKMGFCKSCCVNCLAMCCLIPMSWISFSFFDLGGAISGSLFTNVGEALNSAFALLASSAGLGSAGGLISVLVGGLIGLVMVLIFPIHWLLIYRPDEPMFALAMMIPWVLTVFLSALFWSKSMKDGFMMGIKLAVSWIVIGIVLFMGITSLAASSGMGGIVGTALNGIFEGLTDLSPILAIISASLEGGLIGGVFGGLAGAIKYKPGEEYQPNSNKKAKPASEDSGVAFGSSYTPSQPAYQQQTTKPKNAFQTKTTRPTNCPRCGKPVGIGEDFCTECGSPLK